MKALSVGNPDASVGDLATLTSGYKKGFSTLELMIAFALMSLVMGGVILATFSTNYWAIASETNNEALYKAKTRLEALRSLAKEDFSAVSGSDLFRDEDEACLQGGLCYFIEERVTDISSCSKYAEVLVSSKVPGYPTTTVSLFTTLSNPAGAIAQGGDCSLTLPEGEWEDTDTAHSFTLSGAPTAIDVLSGVLYMGLSAHPYFAIATHGGAEAFVNDFELEDPIHDIDVVRQTATGRVYAFLAIASTSNQFQVVDVTEKDEPVLVASRALPGVAGDEPEGFRIAYFAGRVYITTLRTEGPELHVFDVGTPESPQHRASLELNTSVYSLALREEENDTLLYMTTSHGDREVLVFDVSNPSNPSEILGARTNIPGTTKAGRAIFLHGTELVVGLQSGGGHDLFVLDARDTKGASGGLPVLHSAETSPRSITKLHASGDLLFLASINATPEIQVRKRSDLSLVERISIQNLSDRGMDVEGNFLYAASGNAPHVRIFESE